VDTQVAQSFSGIPVARPREEPALMEAALAPAMPVSTLRHLLPPELLWKFSWGTIVDEELECPALQEQLQIITASFFLTQLLNQRGWEIPEVDTLFRTLNEDAIGEVSLLKHGLNHQQVAAVQELSRLEHEARSPLGPKRVSGAAKKRPKRGRAPGSPGGAAGDAPGQSSAGSVPGGAPMSHQSDQRPNPLDAITLRPLLPERLSRRLPQGGIADKPLQCPEAELRTQLMFAQWVALQLLNETSQLEGVLHDSLAAAVEWCHVRGIVDALHQRVFLHLNRLGNAAKHLPALMHGGGLHSSRGPIVAESHRVLRELAAQL